MVEEVKVGESRSNEEFEFEEVEREEEEEGRRPLLTIKVPVRESVTVSNYLVVSIFWDRERGRLSFSVSAPGDGGLRKIGSARVEAERFVLNLYKVFEYVCEKYLDIFRSIVRLFDRRRE